MKQRNTRFGLLICSTLLGLSLTISAWATDAAKLVESCISCHGKDGTSTEPDVPNIGEHSVTDLTYTMTVYRDEGRPCREAVYLTGDKKGNKTDMCQVVKEMSDSDINHISPSRNLFAPRKILTLYWHRKASNSTRNIAKNVTPKVAPLLMTMLASWVARRCRILTSRSSLSMKASGEPQK
jgi:cytochrome c553